MKHSKIVKGIADLVEPMFIRPAHLQTAALCLRSKGNRREVLLVSSRRTRRWVLPKGWPMAGRTLAGAAAQEAWEEAGVIGTVSEDSLGSYSYFKVSGGGLKRRCRVQVYALQVKRLADDYPEAGQRKRRWVSLKRAARMVREPDLKALLNSL